MDTITKVTEQEVDDLLRLSEWPGVYEQVGKIRLAPKEFSREVYLSTRDLERQMRAAELYQRGSLVFGYFVENVRKAEIKLAILILINQIVAYYRDTSHTWRVPLATGHPQFEDIVVEDFAVQNLSDNPDEIHFRVWTKRQLWLFQDSRVPIM